MKKEANKRPQFGINLTTKVLDMRTVDKRSRVDLDKTLIDIPQNYIKDGERTIVLKYRDRKTSRQAYELMQLGEADKIYNAMCKLGLENQTNVCPAGLPKNEDSTGYECEIMISGDFDAYIKRE